MKKPAKSEAAQKDLVRRSNETIAVQPKTGRITLLTRRLFNIMLYFAQQDGPKEIYRRPLGEIMSHTQFGSNNTEVLKEHLRLMRGVEVEWNSQSGDGRRWGVSGMIAEAEIIESPGIGTFIEWSLPPKIRERLLDPSYYTKLSLQIHSSLRSGASIALYEICSRYASNPSGVTLRAPWEWWRPRITGNPEQEANAEYKYFKRDVLKQSIAEVNAIADFEIELLEFKNGKRVEEIQFAIRRQAQSQLELSGAEPVDGALLERLLRLGLSQSDAREVYANHAEPFLRATIELVEKRAANPAMPALVSKAAWLKSALAKKYVDMPPPGAPAVAPVAVVASPQQQAESRERLREQLLAEFAAHRQSEALRYFRELDAEEQKQKLEDFAGATDVAMVKKELRRRGMSSKLVESAFAEWLGTCLWGVPGSEELLEFSLTRAGGQTGRR